MAEQLREPPIGALWTKNNGKGDYFTGTLELDGKDGEKIRIVVFANKKANDKHPDWKIFRSQSRTVTTGPRVQQSDADESVPF